MSERTVDRLAGDWMIVQLARGHRFSADDMLTAWTAARAAPSARRLLDLGSGIGSVGLMALHQLPEASLVTVEAQAVSYELQLETLARNGLQPRVHAIHGDLRSVELPREFELATGSPPYIPEGHGVLPAHPQKAGARFELRGDVFDYCKAAARALVVDGTFVFCHSGTDPRPERAIAKAGLTLVQRRDVFFRHDKPPTVALFTCRWSGTRDDAEALVIRDETGAHTAEYTAIRQAFRLSGC
ncbi:MAG TPA: methyltransferase [Myxococcota bacterium]|nr:methyltransferase [Myxococcota bacterium]